jgi:hypothetical protein
MEPYNPNERYFGPQGHWLNIFIPPYPLGIQILKDNFNLAAYNHDKGYEGQARSGFMGKIRDQWERWGIDKTFLSEMNEAIEQAYYNEEITSFQKKIAADYANIAYDAVRALGWTFFRKS